MSKITLLDQCEAALQKIAEERYIATGGGEFARGFNMAKDEAANIARATLAAIRGKCDE